MKSYIDCTFVEASHSIYVSVSLLKFTLFADRLRRSLGIRWLYRKYFYASTPSKVTFVAFIPNEVLGIILSNGFFFLSPVRFYLKYVENPINVTFLIPTSALRGFASEVRLAVVASSERFFTWTLHQNVGKDVLIRVRLRIPELIQI